MNLAFDARGRLWVTHSVEYPFAAAAGRPPRDGLTVLEDFGPDGRATKAHSVRRRAQHPDRRAAAARGTATAATEVIVWSIPNIWKLTDTDGDGKADRREVLYGPFDFVDTHGDQNSFRLGPDGWVYACHGFRNDSKVKLRGEGPVVLEMHSGNTYRFRPDGSAIEQVSWGQVNPFGMCFDSLGNQFTADCHSKPITMILRGGYYESFGKPHDGLGFAPLVTGHDHGSTGIAGHGCLRGRRFPAGVPRDHVRRQRDDQPHPPRPDRVAGLVAVGREADRFRLVRRLVVPARRSAARARRRPLRRRLLQLHHRPLRGRPEAPPSRPRPRPDLAGRVEGRRSGRPSRRPTSAS